VNDYFYISTGTVSPYRPYSSGHEVYSAAPPTRLRIDTNIASNMETFQTCSRYIMFKINNFVLLRT